MRRLGQILILISLLVFATGCAEKIFSSVDEEKAKLTNPGENIPIEIDDGEEETSEEENSGEETPNDSEEDKDDEMEQPTPTPTPPVTPTPTPSPTPCHGKWCDKKWPPKDHKDDDDDHDDDDDDNDDDDHDDDDDNDDDDHDDDDDKDDDDDMQAGCSKAPLNDINLHVESLMFKMTNGSVMTVDVGKTMNMSELQQGISFDADTNGNIRDMRVVLDISQSSVESSDGAIYELSAPSHPHRMLKVKIQGKRNMNLMGSYTLEMNLDLDKNLVQNKNKCFFKPVLHRAKLHKD